MRDKIPTIIGLLSRNERCMIWLSKKTMPLMSGKNKRNIMTLGNKIHKGKSNVGEIYEAVLNKRIIEAGEEKFVMYIIERAWEDYC